MDWLERWNVPLGNVTTTPSVQEDASHGLPVGPCYNSQPSNPFLLSRPSCSGKSMCPCLGSSTLSGSLACLIRWVWDIQAQLLVSCRRFRYGKKLKCPFHTHLHIPIKRNAGSHINLMQGEKQRARRRSCGTQGYIHPFNHKVPQ